MDQNRKSRILAVLTILPIIIGIFINFPLALSILILSFFIPLSTYYTGLALMAHAKTKKEENERKKITFTGY
jgi:uncharacterized membrane protein HdeD (DUF308 family)